MISLGSTARHSPWCIGLSAAQRDAIKSDPAWNDGNYGETQPKNGLSLARKIAMISYRSAVSFDQRFARNLQGKNTDYFAVESYLDYQGEKLVERFDANCYLALTEIMDTHDVGRGRGGHISALESITQPTLIISINTDVLYPVHEQEELVEHIPNADYFVIDSINGHDAFLIDLEQVIEAVEPFKKAHWD
jgi:homoserine O-acetyltransferase